MVNDMLNEFKYNIDLATPSQANEILALYDSMRGGLADWDAHYPTEKEITTDLSKNNLFSMTDENGTVIAVISIDEDPEVEVLPNWSDKIAPAAELARLCVREDMHNRGIARKMMDYVFEVLRQRGFHGVHILVREGHVIALQSYSHLGYESVGTCRLMNKDFLCFERPL